MLQTRIIPILLVEDKRLVKTVKFRKRNYVGDPCNTIRIFNELEVDELIILDIDASIKKREPNFKLLHEIASECFMPLAYGGGISELEQAKRIFDIGVEKVSVNSNSYNEKNLISDLAKNFGSQAVIGSIDVQLNRKREYEVLSYCGTKKEKQDPVTKARELEYQGAGELLVTSIDRDGTWQGYDLSIIREISSRVSIPIIANGGAGELSHIDDVVNLSNASAAGLGSMVVYQKKDRGVLINYPQQKIIRELLM